MNKLEEMFNSVEASEAFKEWDKKNEATKKLLSKKEVLCAMGDLASEIIDITSGENPHSAIKFLTAIIVDRIVNELFQDETE